MKNIDETLNKQALEAYKKINTDYSIKWDKEKPKAGLMIEGFAKALMEISKVSTFGADRYGENTWQCVEYERYKNSFARHLLDWYAGKKTDKDSGLMTLAHVAWNALALLELEINKTKNNNNKDDIRSEN